jgi:crotonobetainyl-CoA:carnitine CoA-transferase CaiB-like acyl-CoA transferase
VLGQPDLAADQRFRSNLDRVAHAGELAGIIEGVLADSGSDEVIAALDAVPAVGEHNAAIRAELAGETTKGTQ